MDIRKKIAEMHHMGIKLWLERDELHYSSQKKLEGSEIAFLKENKQEIIKQLKAGNQDKLDKCNTERKFEKYPLTDIQSAYLLGRGDNFEYGGVSSHVYFEVKMPLLEREKTIRIWNKLIERHDNLRLVIAEDQCQKVLENVPEYDIRWHDHVSDDDSRNSILKTREYLSDKYYDVEKWPLYDIAVNQLSDSTIMHLSFDFLVLDWTSIWILLKDFEDMYFKGEDHVPDIKYSFKEYYHDALSKRMSSKYITDEEYWKEKVKSFYEPPLLPVTPEKCEKSFYRLKAVLPQKEWSLLKKQAASMGITQTSALITAFSQCIEMWCEKNEFVLDLTTMNRKGSHEGIGDIIGDFTSTELLNIKIDSGSSFYSNAIAVQNELASDMEHDLFSGIDVLRELRRYKRDASYFLPIVFTSSIGTLENNYEHISIGEGGISQTPQVFLDCQVMEINGALQINWDIRKGVFPEGVMEHAMEKYQQILKTLCDLEKWSEKADISELPEAEIIERNKANSTFSDWEKETLHKKIIENIGKYPERTAVIKNETSVTYGELGKMISGMIAVMRDNGVKKGERIGIKMHHSAVETAAVLAVLCMGCAYVPLDIEQPDERMYNIIDQADIRTVLTDSDVKQDRAVFINCADLSSDDALVCEDVSADSPAYIIFTSGTTGVPKGVVISHNGAANTIKSIYSRLELPEKIVILGLSKLNFDLSVFDIFGALWKGGTVVYPSDESRVDPSHWIKLITKYGVNVWNTVPALMQLLVNHNASENNIKLPLEKVMLSGDWIPVSLPDNIKKMCDAEVISLGGATEASIWSIYHICTPEDSCRASIPYGKPLDNQRFYVLDDKFRSKPVWVAGELYIGGDGLALEYLNDAEKTNASFVTHPVTGERLYRTGDHGRYLPDGDIEFLGRKDAQVKLNGYRIELGEIETALLKDENVSAAAVVLDSHDDDKKLVGFICPQHKKSVTDASGIVDDIIKFSREYQEELSSDDIKSITEKRDIFSLKAILEILREIGLFTDAEPFDVFEFIEKNKAFADNDWIICYWINHLERKGYLEKISEKEYRITEKADELFNTAFDWEGLKSEWSEYVGDIAFIDYIENNVSKLEKLLRKEQDPVELLYPEGSRHILNAIYDKNIFSQYYNRCISEFVLKISAQNSGRKLKILEIGAGSAITSRNVINTLSENGVDFEYRFTDVSNSFIAAAKTAFEKYPNVKYSIYDMNEDISAQGLIPNEFDVVIAVGVLENAKNLSETIANVKKLLGINGWLIFTEPVVEEPWILASQIFMMERPADVLRSCESYISEEKWCNIVCGDESSSDILVLPEKNDAGNIKIFAKQFNNDLVSIDENEISESLGKLIPAYMIPHDLKLIKNMPLSVNGKIDRKKLSEYCDIIYRRNAEELNDSDINANESIDDELVSELCSIIAAVLGVKKIAPKSSLYAHGADSLLMAQAAGKIKEYLHGKLKLTEITFDMILRNLLASANIDSLAGFIRTYTAGNDNSDSVSASNRKIGKLVYFSKGSNTMRVLFHAGFGTMNCMRFLTGPLAAQNKGDVVGIVIDDNEKYCSIPSNELVAVAAEEYAKLIIESAPERVQLIGYCFGGLIAIEAARHLVEAGMDIADITLIDSYPSPFEMKDPIISEAIFLPNFFITFGDVFAEINNEELMNIIETILSCGGNGIGENALLNYVNDNDVSDSLRKKVNELALMTEEERFALYAAKIEENDPNAKKELLLATYRTNISSWRAAHTQPDPYFGKVRFYLAEERSPFLFADRNETIDFWKNICFGELVMSGIKGNHVTCVEDEKNALELAKLLGDFE